MKFIEKIKNNKFLKGASLVLKGITSIVIIFVICIIFIQRISNNKITLGGISMYTVVSESMKPKYEIYDMLIAKKVDPSTIKVGDDVVYMGEKSTLKDKIVTHQVIKKDYKNGKYIFQTKGINNDIADPEIEDRQILAVVVSKSNILSIISHVVNNSYGFYFIIFVPFVILLFFEIVDIKKEKMALKEEKLKKKETELKEKNVKEVEEKKEENKIDVMEEPVLKKINKGLFMNNKVTFLEIIKRLLKKVKLRTLLMLAILLSCNTFAWFIYATKVSNNISAYVRSWKVNFIVGDNNIEETLSFDIESVYPGMPDTEQVITAENDSDLRANLAYEIVSASILGETYTTDTMTSAEIEELIKTKYPFKLNIEIENGSMEAKGGKDNIKFNFTWPFESGDDDLDTKWGYKAYQYKEENPDSKSIILIIKVTATQVNE